MQKTALTVMELLKGTALAGAAGGGSAGYRKGGPEGAVRGAVGAGVGAPLGSALGGIGGGFADDALGTRGLGALGLVLGGVGGGVGGYKALTHGVAKKPAEERVEKTAFYDELAKLGAISDEQAQRTLDQLDSLERNKPGLGQLGRYALVGAAAGPAIKAVGNVIKGRSALDFGAASGRHPGRGLLAETVTGALGAGAVPLLRHHLDRRAAVGTLRDFLKERGPAPAPEPKIAFQVSQYSGPLSEGPFKMTSGLPAPRVPSLTASPVEKPKTAATAVIIKGNPKYVEGNPKADAFYERLRTLLQQRGYGEVKLDSGAPYTQPAAADLWVGHSRGADRLRFAPEQTHTIALGVADGLHHSKDNSRHLKGPPPDTFSPSEHHYKITPKMRHAIPEAGALGKSAGSATTPAGLLASARAVGLPKVTSPGGSIAAIAKPKGFGQALPGATNPNSLR